MGWILRTKDDLNNPTLAGGVYGVFITNGMPVYYKYDGSQTRGIVFISDGGRYGLDRLTSFEYKGLALTEGTQWIFHRGTFPAQIVPLEIIGVNTGTNVLTADGLDLVNDTPVRFGAIDGQPPAPLDEDVIYYIGNVSSDNFKVYDSPSSGAHVLIDIQSAGLGTPLVWQANTGRDDPEQGWPTFCPEVETTFNNIAYVEFKLPINRSSASEQPDWEDFRAIGVGRRLMDYDDTGAELGVIDGDDELLSNVALEVADNLIVNLKCKPSRNDWTSWALLKEAAATLIWNRIIIPEGDPDPTAPLGLTGRYHQDQTFTNLITTKIDSTINKAGTSASPPASGVTGTNFSVRWTGRIKPEFSETYALSIDHDDSVKLWIDGNLIMDEPVTGVDAVDFVFVADRLYDIQIEWTQNTGDWRCEFYWQSPSQPVQVVPSDRLYQADTQVRRYECHMAFPIPTEAGEVHERLMERCPGWHWTDRDGKVEYLGPDRPIAFAFIFDRMDDDNEANLVKEKFVKKRKAMADRRNFLLFRYRNVDVTGYPFAFVQADREALRRFTNGEPSNDPASDLGVMTRSLAERLGENQMVFKSDPTHSSTLSGGRASSGIRKNELVSVSYFDNDDNFVADATYMVVFHSWGARNDQQDFNLIPIAQPFYTDEPVVADDEDLSPIEDSSDIDYSGTGMLGFYDDLYTHRGFVDGKPYYNLFGQPASLINYALYWNIATSLWEYYEGHVLQWMQDDGESRDYPWQITGFKASAALSTPDAITEV